MSPYSYWLEGDEWPESEIYMSGLEVAAEVVHDVDWSIGHTYTKDSCEVFGVYFQCNHPNKGPGIAGPIPLHHLSHNLRSRFGAEILDLITRPES